MINSRISVKQILVDIISVQEQAFKTFKESIEHSAHVSFLESNDYCNDDELLNN